MHAFEPVALIRIDPLEVEPERLEDPFFVPRASQLTIDEEPGFYIYEMSYRDESGVPIRTRGVVGKLVLGPPSVDVFAPSSTPSTMRDALSGHYDHLRCHERTIRGVDGHTHDRADSHGPIWLLAEDDALEEALSFPGELVARMTDTHGIHHRMTEIYQAGHIETIATIVHKARLAVADGHHRLRRAIAGISGDARSEEPRSLLAYITTMSSALPLIRPIHRAFGDISELDAVIGNLSEAYNLEEISSLSLDVSEHRPILITTDSIFAISTVKAATTQRRPQDLADAEILEPFWITPPGETYYRYSPTQILNLVKEGRAQLGLICAPVSPERLIRAVDMGDLLPPKSTHFYPKPLGTLMLSESD